MKRFKLLSIAMLAVFAFAAVLAASASAATFLLAEWLVGGSPVTTELLTESIGELLLEDEKVPLLGKAAVECSGNLEGWVGPNSLDWISEVLSLSGGAAGNTGLSGTALVCRDETNCEEPLVWASHLPWETEAELMEDEGLTLFADLILPKGGTTVGWEVECMKTIIGAQTDECTQTEGVSELALEGTSLIGGFSRAFTILAGAKLANCTLGGSESGIVEGKGPIVVKEGGELTASSEGISS